MSEPETRTEDEEKKEIRGGRNLILLGVISTLIAISTSLISLYIYHKSGDIYLDCSMPGADCPSAHSNSEENKTDEAYEFSDSGEITTKSLEEFLKEYNSASEKLRKISEPFSGEPLSDESLGI
ncbi:hypothetical protein IJF91_02890 [Candidatus Saccharibacteria bacterium]|nr:hypothetical protein [Candidatus Saccharibacteria bacterium]